MTTMMTLKTHYLAIEFEITALQKVDGHFPVVNENDVDWTRCLSDLEETILTFPLLHYHARIRANYHYDQRKEEEPLLKVERV